MPLCAVLRLDLERRVVDVRLFSCKARALGGVAVRCSACSLPLPRGDGFRSGVHPIKGRWRNRNRARVITSHSRPIQTPPVFWFDSISTQTPAVFWLDSF